MHLSCTGWGWGGKRVEGRWKRGSKTRKIEGTRSLCFVLFFGFSSHWIGLHLITESEFVYTHMNGCDGCLTYLPTPRPTSAHPPIHPGVWAELRARPGVARPRRHLSSASKAWEERIMGNRAVVAVDALTPLPPHHTHTSAKCSLLILPSTICEKKSSDSVRARREPELRFPPSSTPVLTTRCSMTSCFFFLIMTFKHKSCDKRCFEIGLYFRYEMIACSHFFNRFLSSPSSFRGFLFQHFNPLFLFKKKAR